MFSDKIHFIKWYHKLFLWILPKRTTTEYFGQAKNILVYKRCFGVTYILSNKYRWHNLQKEVSDYIIKDIEF